MYVHQREVAEEIVSDVFVNAWLNRASMQHVERADTYFFVSVKNQSLNYLKKYFSIRLVQLEDFEEVDLIDTVNPQTQLEAKELHFHLDRSIATLPLQCRIIFRLIKEQGLKYKEVAEILDISPRTVQTQLFRAITKLKASLTTYLSSSPASSCNKDALLNIFLLLSAIKIFF